MTLKKEKVGGGEEKSSKEKKDASPEEGKAESGDIDEAHLSRTTVEQKEENDEFIDVGGEAIDEEEKHNAVGIAKKKEVVATRKKSFLELQVLLCVPVCVWSLCGNVVYTQLLSWNGKAYTKGKVFRQEQLPHEMLLMLLKIFARVHSQQRECCVIDPFIGTGSTAVAALALGCKCIGMDICPEAAVQSVVCVNPHKYCAHVGCFEVSRCSLAAEDSLRKRAHG